MTVCATELPYDFYAQRSLSVQFSDLELSADAGILLARQAEETVQVCQRLADCIEEWRDPNKITHSLHQLVSQRVYQLVGGYEDANDSNQLRHDPIYKIACGRLPLADQEHLASQPTITRLENHISKREIAAMRSRLVEGFIQRYKVAPAEIVLDIDGWDDHTHGEQQLSCFHGYYGQHMYFPVLINDWSLD
jgi:Transposase DDE domain group 1